MRIRKSGYIALDRTYCSTRKFNVALSLCRVLGVTLYFSKGFLEVSAEESAVAAVLQSLGVTMVYFLEQESNLWSSTLQWRHRLFLKCFFHLSLVNLLLLASLEEKFIYRELDCFLGAENKGLDGDDLVDEATRNVFALFLEAMALSVEKALSCFQK